jgi:hypothetical protein
MSFNWADVIQAKRDELIEKLAEAHDIQVEIRKQNLNGEEEEGMLQLWQQNQHELRQLFREVKHLYSACRRQSPKDEWAVEQFKLLL